MNPVPFRNLEFSGLGPPVVPFYMFLQQNTKKDYSDKRHPYSNSLLEDLVVVSTEPLKVGLLARDLGSPVVRLNWHGVQGWF